GQFPSQSSLYLSHWANIADRQYIITMRIQRQFPTEPPNQSLFEGGLGDGFSSEKASPGSFPSSRRRRVVIGQDDIEEAVVLRAEPPDAPLMVVAAVDVRLGRPRVLLRRHVAVGPEDIGAAVVAEVD